MFSKLKGWIFREPLLLDWVQVEVTSYCNAHCIYCPRTIYKSNWCNRHMDLETFSKIVPFLENTRLVYLQGWGEPFLNPSILEMIKISKGRGCTVGLTTNANILDTLMIKGIIQSGLDIIAFSLTGDSETNDTIRKGTRYDKVISVIKDFTIQKQLLNSFKPLINIAYLLLTKDLKGIYEIIDKAQELGLNQIVVSSLDFIANQSSLDYVATYNDEEIHCLKLLKLYASQKSVQLLTNLIPSQHPLSVCAENVTNSLYISADGTVSPCVYLNLPINTEVTYYPQGLQQYKRVIWGAIQDKSLLDIWFSKGFSTFRKDFLVGKYTAMCKLCPKLYLHDLIC